MYAHRCLLRYGSSAAVVMAIGALTARAAPPLNPLPAPHYSFDRQSPSVMGGIVGASDVLALGPSGPVVVIPGPALGLLTPLDDLDSLSSSHAAFPPGQPFALLFSVDRVSRGFAPPDPALVAAGVPYNVRDQAERGHAAGDEYLSTSLYALSGTERIDRVNNHAMVRNNYDEGGTDFGAAPPTSGSDVVPPGTAQDDVDGTSYSETAAERGVPIHLYFSASADSPSLASLPGSQFPSGASIFFNAAPLDGTPTELYAPFFALGLIQNDDIDALIVFDRDHNGIFSPGDGVLFSLTRASPSLMFIPGASPEAAAADIFLARFGQPPVVFAPAASLGLGDPLDNVDALELIPTPNAEALARTAGIRYLRGDMNCDGVVDFADIDPFVLALSGPDAYRAAFPFCFWNAADDNCDSLVDFADIDPFVACLSGHCPCQ